MRIDEIASKIVKQGIYVYGDITEYFVFVCEENVLYGTGDYEDIPEVANDQEMQCYTVYYSDIQDKNVINASAGQFKSYEDAIAIVEGDEGFLKWIDE